MVLCIVWTKRSDDFCCLNQDLQQMLSISMGHLLIGTRIPVWGHVGGVFWNREGWEHERGLETKGGHIRVTFLTPQYSADWNQSLYIMKVEDPFLDFQMINLTLLRNKMNVWMTSEDYSEKRKTFSYFLSFDFLRCLFFNNHDCFLILFFSCYMFWILLNKTLWQRAL